MKITHSFIEKRSLGLHKAVADKIRQEPALLDMACENLKRWSESLGSLPPALQEWQDILATSSVEEVLKLIVDPAPNATRLRQSSPFGGILSEDERLRILKEYESQAA